MLTVTTLTAQRIYAAGPGDSLRNYISDNWIGFLIAVVALSVLGAVFKGNISKLVIVAICLIFVLSMFFNPGAYESIAKGIGNALS